MNNSYEHLPKPPEVNLSYFAELVSFHSPTTRLLLNEKNVTIIIAIRDRDKAIRCPLKGERNRAFSPKFKVITSFEF